MVDDDRTNWGADGHHTPDQQEGRDVPQGWTVQQARHDSEIPDGLSRFRLTFDLVSHLIGLPSSVSVIEISVDNEQGSLDFTAEIPGQQGRVTPLFGRIEEERIVIGRFDPTEM